MEIKGRGKLKVLVTQLYPTLYDPMGYIALQTPPSMGFSRREYWRGLPFSSPGDLPNQGIEPGSPALQARWGHRNIQSIAEGDQQCMWRPPTPQPRVQRTSCWRTVRLRLQESLDVGPGRSMNELRVHTSP